VEIFRKNFLASIVPVIVNAVLNSHHLIVDIVAFVARGDFPRSRLGEKQRGKILASWVTRKLRTIAQFGIRDPDGGLNIADIPEESKNGTGIGGGRRAVSMTSSQQHNSMIAARNSQHRSQTLSQDYAELSAHEYHDSIPELPAHHSSDEAQEAEEMPDFDAADAARSDDTPTGPGGDSLGTAATWSNHSRQVSHELGVALDYSPIDKQGPFADDTPLEQYGSQDPLYNIDEIPLPLQPRSQLVQDSEHGTGEEVVDPPSPSWKKKPFPSQEAEGKEVYVPKAAPRKSADEEDEWKKDAGMYMNFGGSGPGSLEYGR
jgi:hypothetical protein